MIICRPAAAGGALFLEIPIKTYAYAATAADKPLAPFSFERRALRGNDVAIEILYCGVCHSDLHTARNDWSWTNYPIVVGHEIVGRVTEVGPDVTRHKVGDHVAVGTMVDSCQHCDQCHRGEEQLCREGNTQTFGGVDRISGEPTMGGYAKHIVVREEFVLHVPKDMDLARAGPLLCAGATTYSPLRVWNVGPGSRVGVIGMGGLGHMAIKLAIALGASVTVVSRSASKKKDATELGANDFLISSDIAAMGKAASSFDLIIDTVPTKHDLTPYLPLLDMDGTLCIVGQIGPLDEMNSLPLLLGRRRVAGSAIAGIAETQEMLDFCARKNVLPEVEMIRIDQINEAYERLERSDVRYRFVIDMAALNEPQTEAA